MPSTVVHVGLAALIGIALLDEHFDVKAIFVVMAVTALIDLDTLLGMVFEGTHRALFHNVFIVLAPLAVLYWDVRLREKSFVLSRWGEYGYRVGWVSLVALMFAHILLDAFYNGVNLFWPLHDQFYDLSGEVLISNQEGFVQTFVEFETGDDGTTTVDEDTDRGTTNETHYRTGFDPGPDAEPDTEREFPIAESGELFIVAVSGYVAAGYRIAKDLRSTE